MQKDIDDLKDNASEDNNSDDEQEEKYSGEWAGATRYMQPNPSGELFAVTDFEWPSEEQFS